jgi:hypothetical protein
MTQLLAGSNKLPANSASNAVAFIETAPRKNARASCQLAGATGIAFATRAKHVRRPWH